MRINADGEEIQDPTVADVRRLIPDRAPHEDWGIELARSLEDSIEADAADEGRYTVAYVSGNRIFDGARAVEGAELRDLFERFHQGDGSWRDTMEWKAWQSPPKPSPLVSKGLPWGIGILAVIGVIALPFLPLGLAQIPWPSLPLPAALDSTLARVFLGVFAFLVGLVLIAVIVKLVETRRAARWPRTHGRIVKSERGFERNTDADGRERDEPVALIEYEFEVDKTLYRGTRFTMAEKVAENEIAGYLARYPVGKLVPVFYAPKNPENATLDRDLPKGVMLGCGALLAIGIAVLIGAMYLATNGAGAITARFPGAIPPLVAMFGIGALMSLGTTWIAFRRALAARAWKQTKGRVTLSEIRASRGETTSMSPLVEYEYVVRGKAYRSRSLRLDAEIGGSEAYARKMAEKFSVGTTVTVRYDPQAPEQATLEVKIGWAWFLAAFSLGLLALTAWSAGLFTDGPPLGMR